MSQPFIGEIKVISWNFAPKGWGFCNGQLLPINQNQALFSLLGTTYGGDGRVNFGLPNFQGRTPVHVGGGFTQGQAGGETSHTLVQGEMPQHTHTAQVQSANATTGTPNGNLLAGAPSFAYRNSLTNPTTLVPGTITNAGGGQPHANQQPFLVLNFIIALQGIFPSRN